MGTSLSDHRLRREGDHFVVTLTEHDVEEHGLREGQSVRIVPVRASSRRPKLRTMAHRRTPPPSPAPHYSIKAALETVIDIVASRIALAEYRRYGRTAARDAEDVFSDLGL